MACGPGGTKMASLQTLRSFPNFHIPPYPSIHIFMHPTSTIRKALWFALLTFLGAVQLAAQCGINIPDGERCEAPGGTNCEFYICVAGSCQPAGVYYPAGTKCGCFGDECYDDFCDGNGNCQCVLTPAPFGTRCASEQNICNGEETCDGISGRRCDGPINQPAAGCDDGISCTHDCNPVDGCVTYPIDARCDDSNLCTIDECDTTGLISGCNNVCNPIAACVNDPACTTFPISLLSFDGELDGLTLSLRWMTGFELNNRGFEVWMREANEDFAKVGFVAGSGTTQDPQFYSFSTLLPHEGLYIVKLRQIDLNGGTTESKVLRFKAESGHATALFPPFPNPTESQATVRFQVFDSGFCCVRLFDAGGKTVSTLFEGTAEKGKLYHIDLDAEPLPPGMYFVHLKTSLGVYTQKLLRY